jgi:hypothetical protein
MNKENEYARRLHFISEDVKSLSDVLTDEILDTPVPNYENIGVVLSNIEIASNLNDDESSNWKTKFQIPTHDPQTGELNPFYEELTGKKNPLVDPDLIIKVEPRMIREDFKKEKDIDKMPNQKWHQIVSFIKSGVRIVGYCFIPFNLVVATTLLILSEVIGIIEEIV